MTYRRLLLFFIIFIGQNQLFAQTDREFWFVAPEVTFELYKQTKYFDLGGQTFDGGEPVFLRFVTLEKPADIIVTMPANPAFDTLKFSVAANTNFSYNLSADPLRKDLLENQYVNNGYGNCGIHIESTNLITCYYEVYTVGNTDIFALKGNNALGTEFYTPFQTKAENQTFKTAPAYSAIDIVATKDNTLITITPSKNAHDGFPGGSPFLITLNKGETYTVFPQDFDFEPANRLAGTHIESNAPIAVTISDDAVKYPANGCFDLCGDQLVPTDVIGTEYIALRGKLGEPVNPNIADQLYILATEDNTDVFLKGVYATTLDKGETYFYYFDKNLDYAVHIRTTYPVYALHATGFGCEMGQAILAPTNECTGSTEVGFVRSTDLPCFLNIMVRKEGYDDFTLNGVPILTKLSDWTIPSGDDNWYATIIDLDTLSNPDINMLETGLLKNSEDLFHMGLINGNKNRGCKYGYFSDYNKLKISAITGATGTGFYRVCYGEEVQLEGYGGTDFYWTPSDFLDDPLSRYPTLTPRYTTKYVLHVSGACGYSDSAEVTIQVLNKVESIFTLDTTQACAPHEITINNTSIGADDPYNAYKWTFGDGAISNSGEEIIKHTFQNTTDTIATYEIQLVTKNISSCRDTLKRYVRLFPEIDAGYIQDNIVGCQPFSVSFTNTSTGTNNAKIPYLWDFGDGASSTDTSTSHTYSMPVIQADTTFNVKLLAHNEFFCYDSAVSQVTIHPFIDARFSPNKTESCNPFDAEITNNSLGVDNYIWNFGDGSPPSVITDTNFFHIYNNTTGVVQKYTIELAAQNDEGCVDTVRKTITVYPELTAAFTASIQEGCDSLVVAFTNSSVGAIQYLWDFGDGAGSTKINPTHIYRNFSSSDTTYTVRLIIGTKNMACTDTASIDILVHPYIKAGISTVNTKGCTPFQIPIENTSEQVDSYNWYFGDGDTSISNSRQLIHQYTNTDNVYKDYTLKLVVNNNEGCSDSVMKNIRVYPNIGANFILNQSEACYGDTIKITNLSAGAQLYEWNFGDNATSSAFEPRHVYNYKGSTDSVFTINLRVLSDSLSSCSDQYSLPLTMHSYSKASFSASDLDGCTPFTLQLKNTSVGVSSLQWNFGDGTITDTLVADLSHLYTNEGSTVLKYPVSLHVVSSTGCKDSLLKTISVYPQVSAHFVGTSGCSPLWVSDFQNTSVNADAYFWDFGDGSSSASQFPSHTFKNTDNISDTSYTVTLQAQSKYGCSAQYDTVVTVYVSPKANFSLTNTSNCFPYNVVFENLSQGYDSAHWDFGNNTDTALMDKNFNVLYTNNTTSIIKYPVTLTVTNSTRGCADTIIRNLTAYPPVSANFELTSGCDPLQITDFKNTSTGAADWEWDMGDGNTINTKNPEHIFRNFSRTNDTSYNITLYAISFTGCTDTLTKTLTVYHRPESDFNIGQITGCSPYVVPFENTSIGADSQIWNFGNGYTTDTITQNSFIHNYQNNTDSTISYPVTLVSYTTMLCTDTITHSAYIYPDITAQFSIESGCDSLFISSFNNTSLGLIDSYYWNFGDNTSSSLANPQHWYRNYSNTVDSVYTISLSIENSNGCTDFYDTVITIYPRPKSAFTISNIPGCSPLKTDIENNSTGAEEYVWSFGDFSSSSTETAMLFSHTYTNTGSDIALYPLQLVASNQYGCTDTLVRNVPVYPQVVTSFNIESGCNPHVINNFQNTTINAALFNWNFGDGESSSLEHPQHTYKNYSRDTDTSFVVKLYAESIYGCTDSSSKRIEVFHKPHADFNINNSPVCAPDTIFFSNNSIGSDTQYWYWGDNSSDTLQGASLVKHYYTNTESVLNSNTVTLIVATNNGCTDTAYHNAIVYPYVEAYFESEITGCSPLTVHFDNQSIGGAVYDWMFGDGNSSNNKNPVHTFYNYSNIVDSIHSCNLVVTSQYGCTDEMSTYISVYPNPKASFSIINSPSCSPAAIEIQSFTSGATAIIWNFDDFQEELHSENIAFAHTYDNPATDYKNFRITQIVRNSRIYRQPYRMQSFAGYTKKYCRTCL